MANKYLISAMVNSVETFYTAYPDGTISAIGNLLDWNSGFDDNTLSCIDNSVYSTLENAKIWVNSSDASTMATEETTGEGFVYTTDATAIDCKGYSGITSITGVSSNNNNVKIAISFDGKKYYTRKSGYVANTTVAIPTSADGRKSAGITINEETFGNIFNDNTTDVASFDSENPVDIPVVFTTGLVARRHTITIPPTCRLPLTIEFQVFDPSANAWVTLDTIIAKASKTINRYFANEIESTSYRWVLSPNPGEKGDDPTRTIDVSEANTFGRVTGMVWTAIDVKNIKTDGMPISTLNALTSADYTEIFDQTQIDYAIYIPAGHTFTSLTAVFPANSAPVIDYFRALTNKIHAGDVDVIFKVTDPEGGAVNYRIFVNKELVTVRYGVTSGSEFTETIPNEVFKQIDLTDTSVIEATNTITLEVEDEYGATASESYIVTKVDRLPTLVGVLDPDTYEYSFTISDNDNDMVKYAAYINDVETPIATSAYMKVPTQILSFTIPLQHIKIGETNTLKIVLTDSVVGESTVLANFIGTYPSLLFYDENMVLLSTNFGEVLKKLDLGTICCGQCSSPVKVFIENNTSKAVKDVVINSPKDIDGKDVPIMSGAVQTGLKHIDGYTWVQLSTDDDFLNPDTYYAISISNLASHEKKPFFVRVNSTSPSAKPGTFDSVVISADSTIVDKLNTMRR